MDSPEALDQFNWIDFLYRYFLPLVTAFVGAWFSQFLRDRHENAKMENVRKIANSALGIFKKYNSYKDGEKEFNAKLNVSEKRAVVVALHKLGLPIDLAKTLSVREIVFLAKDIDSKEIESMMHQISKGNCDLFFFMDFEQTLGSQSKLQKLRANAIKFIDTVFRNSTIDANGKNVIFPSNWSNNFSFCELFNLKVIREIILDRDFFDTRTLRVDDGKVNRLVEDIESGVFDQYLLLEYYTFQNIREQRDLASEVRSSLRQQVYQNQVQVNLNASSDNKPATQ